jgi:hypothetical protein
LKVSNAHDRIPVCRAAIIAMFNLGSEKRLRSLDSFAEFGDQRGKKKTARISPQIKHCVKNHIKSFPRHKSHFNLRNHPNKLYIDRVGVRSVSDMHDLYISKYENTPELHSTLHFYRLIFNTYNLGFVGGRTDECGVCKLATSNNSRETRIFREHLLNAKTARESMKTALNQSEEESFFGQRDLKSVTYVPQLTHGEMHYKRALSCYTSIITNAKTKQATLYNWHEGEAARGVNEMIQVRMNFIDEDDEIEDYDFSEDNCAGQNKSRANPVADLYAIQNGKARSITTRFYETGHSFMPPDQCGGTINIKLRNHKSKLETPDAAFNLMTRKNPSDFTRVRMPRNGWKDWWKLAEDHARVLGRLAWREDGTREPLHFSEIAIWKVTSEHPWKIFFKYSHLEGEDWKHLRVKKSPNTPLMSAAALQSCNNEVGGKEIKKAKWTDLQEIAPYLKRENQDFYRNLSHDGIDAPDGEDVFDDEEEFDFARPYRFCDEWLTPEQLYVKRVRFISEDFLTREKWQ